MTLSNSLVYQPVELRFGTSGRRGRVADLSQLEIYLNVRAEMDFLLEEPASVGGIHIGDTVYLAYDLRPSSIAFVPDQQHRGELLQATFQAIQDAGLKPVNLGAQPSPVLMAYALQRKAASVMITGSHIPFDRNGYKLNTSIGELQKHHEAPIAAHTTRWRTTLMEEDAGPSLFNEHGMFRNGSMPVPSPHPGAAEEYIQRYVNTFGVDALVGYTLLFYQHSSVGRDLLPMLLESLGASVLRRGRSETFVPIDTESLGTEQLDTMQQLLHDALAEGHGIDAVVSADGDADRPLLLAANGQQLHFIPGDSLGMLAALFLKPDAIVVPISCNDGIDRFALREAVQPKTRIGSPFVIAGMDAAIHAGKQQVCGWEANGGFLLASTFHLTEGPLTPLPTRDSALPILAALAYAKSHGITLQQAFDQLPQRFVATALLREFPRAKGLELVASLSPTDSLQPDADLLSTLNALLTPSVLADVAHTNYTDGVRVIARNGDTVHLRPSGNADEFRVYAVADTKARAAQIASAAEQVIRAYAG